METDDLARRLEFATEIAREAGELTLSWFRRPDLRAATKRDGSVVTEADSAAEELLRRRIARRYPDDAILGEEQGESAGTSGGRWILDPIDGTESYARGVPLYGTLIGYEEHGDTVLGVVGLPAVGELVCAARGLGAHWHVGDGPPREARVSAVRRLEDACFSTTAAALFRETGRAALLEAMVGRVRVDRGYGDCYGHVLVATGRIDVMIDPLMHVWDCAALKPVVEEAGGRFVDLAGEATIRGGSAVSTNAHLYAEVMDVVRGSSAGAGGPSGA